MDYVDLVWQSLLKDIGELTYHLDKLQSSLNPEMGKNFDSSKEIIKIKDTVEKINGIVHVN
jgi:ABC-type Fe2+-enterobactin transport system substrate-binding protein